MQRLGSIRNYPSIEEMKKINLQDNDPKNSKKTSGYLPLSTLDLKVLIREVKNSFKNFKDENMLDKKGIVFLSGRNSQHKNLVEILGESLCMDTFLISPPANHWLEEFTYNPDEINQFSMSRIIGLGLTLIKDIELKNYIPSSNFIIQKFINKKEVNNIDNLNDLKKDSANLNIKDKKQESKLKPKEKEVISKKAEELPPLPNLNIKDKKQESKLKPKEKGSDIQKSRRITTITKFEYKR